MLGFRNKFGQGGLSQSNFIKVNDKIVVSEVELGIGVKLTANTTDGAYEKHVPVIEHTGDYVTVKVGSVAHPMLDAHWIVLDTNTGYQKEACSETGRCSGGAFRCDGAGGCSL